MQVLNVIVGINCYNCVEMDECRVKKAECSLTDTAKDARKALRTKGNILIYNFMHKKSVLKTLNAFFFKQRFQRRYTIIFTIFN